MDESKNQSINALWYEYEPYIRKLCNYKLYKHAEYIDDCIQDIFTDLTEEIHKGTELTNPKAWLTVVANNKINDVLKFVAKKSNKTVSLSDEKVADKIYSTDSFFDEIPVSDEQILEIKSKIIEMLDKPEQQLLYERYELKTSISEIAKKNNTNENNVYQRLFRLRCKTKQLIKAYFE